MQTLSSFETKLGGTGISDNFKVGRQECSIERGAVPPYPNASGRVNLDQFQIWCTPGQFEGKADVGMCGVSPRSDGGVRPARNERESKSNSALAVYAHRFRECECVERVVDQLYTVFSSINQPRAARIDYLQPYFAGLFLHVGAEHDADFLEATYNTVDHGFCRSSGQLKWYGIRSFEMCVEYEPAMHRGLPGEQVSDADEIPVTLVSPELLVC